VAWVALTALPIAVAGMTAVTAAPAVAATAAGPDPTLLVGSFPNAGGGSGGVVQGFSTSSLSAVGPSGGVGVGGQPWTMAVTPNASTAYVGNFSSGTVTPVNVSSTLSTGTSLCLPVGNCPADTNTEPEAVAVTPGGSAAYVANSNENSISEILLTGSSAPKVANTPVTGTQFSDPAAIAITPNGTTAWVANYGNGTIVPIELRNNDAVGTPLTLPAGSRPTGLAITPDGTHLLVADSGTGQVTDVNLATLAMRSVALEPTAAGPVSPWAVAITPDGSTAWFTDRVNGVVVPFTIANDTPGSPVAVGSNPVAVAIADTASGLTAYVADQLSQEVSVVEIGGATPRQTAAIPTTYDPDTVAVTPD
jgi:DNA-binding beta-propeller fold protein YncE